MKIEAVRTKITPKMAAAMLEHRPPHQRPLNEIHIVRITNDIVNGRWQENGDTITIDLNGDLLDGQHRLHAIVRAGVAVWTLVVTGIHPEAFKTKDIGRKRTPGDTFASAGVNNANAAATVSRYLMACEQALSTGLVRYVHATSDELLEYAQANGESVQLAVSISARIGRRFSGSSSVGAALAFLHRYAPEPAASFTDAIADGALLTVDSPALIFRNHLLERARLTSELSARRIAETAAMFSAWTKGVTLRGMSPINTDANNAVFMPLIYVDEKHALDREGRAVVRTTALESRRRVAGSTRVATKRKAQEIS